ncbi:MAG TPA: 1,4-alpha-glucan branching protein GlgB [Candidatus Limnocylindria bacterium]|nr:1,4-alpha-glucan branching protein GlgB [Candidatus Limnocylindria bacterium]
MKARAQNVQPRGRARTTTPARKVRSGAATRARASSRAGSAAAKAISGGQHGAPFDVLGPHSVHLDGKPGTAVRAFLPGAREAAVVVGRRAYRMERTDKLFEVVIPEAAEPFPYRLRVTRDDGETVVIEDPYRFPPLLSEFDLHLFGEGTHEHLYEKMGAQIVRHEGVRGVDFTVWAPNARVVSLVGDFNGWDFRTHPMRQRGDTGVWELFVPDLGQGDLYKFAILAPVGPRLVKADPYGFAMELPPNTASVVWDLNRFRWSDDEWMERRGERQALDRPLLLYEVHAGSWRRVKEDGNRWLSWAELARELIPYAKRMGYTHLELLPITEHPFDGSWGYQPVGLFAPTSRFGTPDDFRRFIDAAHRAGLGVVLDWVPAHFPKDAHGLGFFDGTHLYEHADPRQGQHKDWDTYIYNFGRPQVCGFLYASALFWLDRYHVDGLRVDAVASMLYLDYSRKDGEWVANRYGGRENLEAIEFLKRLNVLLHARFPSALTFAEESTAWPRVTGPVRDGGLGFDLKWNMGWMNDMLEYMSMDPLGRAHHQGKLTFSLYYAFSERFLLPLSHDEVVHGKRSLLSKMPGDRWKKLANLRALYAYMGAHPGKKLLFMGGELGQPREWAHDDGLRWDLLDEPDHARLHRFVRELNALVASEPALHEQDFDWHGFEWIDFQDAAQSIVSFVRRAKDPENFLVVAANFTPVPREGYRIGVPSPGRYEERLNSDARRFGGSGVGQPRGVTARPVACHGRDHSVELRLPPLGVLILKPSSPEDDA